MLKNILYRILEKRHFWRYSSFSEIAELYASRTLRIIAINLASGFASVYLYEIGYSLISIVLFWAGFYLLKVPLAFVSSKIAARYGPKHGILISNLLSIPAMVALGLAPVLGPASIAVWGLFASVSASLYQLCYLIDFSKIKNVEHAGKELAFMNILEKIAVGISPIIGGLIALYFGPSVVMWAAAVFFLIATLPLLATIETVRIRQKIVFQGFPWRMAYRSMISQVGLGFDVITTSTAWSLFIAIVIFPHAGNEVYVTLGTLSSVTIIAAVLASYAYGKLIDRSQGGSLLRISVIANALVHVSRPFVASPATIVGTNITNEVATMGYTMAYMRGLFDTADMSGHRIVYLSLTESIANFGAAIACGVLVLTISLFGDQDGLRAFFFVAAAVVLLIGSSHFRIYRR
jgi:MFS family permease